MSLTFASLPDNKTLWDIARKLSPAFRAVTGEGTLQRFDEVGFEELGRNSATSSTAIVDMWFGVLMPFVLDRVKPSDAVDRLEAQGFGEDMAIQYGGIIQRMAVETINPITPQYRVKGDGDTANPYYIRKPKLIDRYWQQNFDYQSSITIGDMPFCRAIYTTETGMSQYMAGAMQALNNGFIVQKYNNKLEAINAAIHSEQHPLQTSQQFELEYEIENPTTEQQEDLIIKTSNVFDAMTLYPQTKAFNAYKFMSAQDTASLKLLMRPGIMNNLKVKTKTGAYNPENLSFKCDIVEVPHFGGLKPFKEAEYTTPLYNVYSPHGEAIGFTSVEGGTTVEVATDDVYWKDPNEDIVCILADSRCIFTNVQNGYSVEGVRMPDVLATNYWASAPGNTVGYDSIYNFVVFRAKPKS